MRFLAATMCVVESYFCNLSWKALMHIESWTPSVVCSSNLDSKLQCSAVQYMIFVHDCSAVFTWFTWLQCSGCRNRTQLSNVLQANTKIKQNHSLATLQTEELHCNSLQAKSRCTLKKEEMINLTENNWLEPCQNHHLRIIMFRNRHRNG